MLTDINKALTWVVIAVSYSSHIMLFSMCHAQKISHLQMDHSFIRVFVYFSVVGIIVPHLRCRYAHIES